ncbi:hypothetical protein [Xanthomonas sacchari]|uniref:hypothetical protein n=1 Tax=Xanthomonas sacchari TaxID=56458 RepID=UPI0031BD3CE5|nr:hypothetical protein [Xanthomonas campestris pv. cannae]
MSHDDTGRDRQNAHRAGAAADKPMVITSTSYEADVVTVSWEAVNYKGGEGFVIGIMTGASKLTNFEIGDPKATRNQVDFTCEAGGVYTVVVEPIIRGRPKDALSSEPVGIPYP